MSSNPMDYECGIDFNCSRDAIVPARGEILSAVVPVRGKYPDGLFPSVYVFYEQEVI